MSTAWCIPRAHSERLTTSMGREDMAADDESYGSNELRVAKQAEIDAAITEWTLSQPSATAVCTILDSVEVRQYSYGTNVHSGPPDWILPLTCGLLYRASRASERRLLSLRVLGGRHLVYADVRAILRRHYLRCLFKNN